VHRVFFRASALASFGALISCSVLLDWAAYSGGAPDVSNGDDTGSPDATGDANRDEDSAPQSRDAQEEGSSPPEAGPDVAPDALPACAPSCHGCCADNNCNGGQSDDSCGVGGQACVNCLSSAMACANGQCAPPLAVDAAQRTCTLSTCAKANLCIPVWQSSCCKSDGTCGCQVDIPPGPCY
jgi:hypothetical protein